MILIPGEHYDLSEVVMNGKWRNLQTVVDRMFGQQY